MKRILITVCVLCALFLSACASSKSVKTYDIVFADIDPFELTSVPVFINGLLPSSLNQTQALMVLDPRTGVLDLEVRYQSVKVVWSCDEPVRNAFIQAIDKYSGEFDNRTLDPRGRKRAAYGKVPVPIQWGLLFMNGAGTASLEKGYIFVDSAPYFTLTMPVTDNRLATSMDESVPPKSPYVSLSFTRAQAERFSEVLSREYIQEAVDSLKLESHLLPGGEVNINAPDKY